MANMSEDALFKALLKNKPEAQKQQAPVKPVQPLPAPVKKEEPKPTPAPVYQKEPVFEPAPTPGPAPVRTEAIEDAIINLNNSVNAMFGFIKTVIVPILALILIVGVLILVKSK